MYCSYIHAAPFLRNVMEQIAFQNAQAFWTIIGFMFMITVLLASFVSEFSKFASDDPVRNKFIERLLQAAYAFIFITNAGPIITLHGAFALTLLSSFVVANAIMFLLQVLILRKKPEKTDDKSTDTSDNSEHVDNDTEKSVTVDKNSNNKDTDETE